MGWGWGLARVMIGLGLDYVKKYMCGSYEVIDHDVQLLDLCTDYLDLGAAVMML